VDAQASAGPLVDNQIIGGGRSLPFPSLARIRYLSFYPLMLAARVVRARRHMRGGRRHRRGWTAQ